MWTLRRPQRGRLKPGPEPPPDWKTEAVRAAREAVGSSSRTTRIAVLLLAASVLLATATWSYQELTARSDSRVQISFTITKN
jgi:hypothetical protein